MTSLVLHPASKTQLERFTNTPSHALLILAPTGSGKRSVAEMLARTLLNIPENKNLREHQHVLYISPEKLSIPIDAIRSLQKNLQLKTIGQTEIRRVVIIEAAHTMTREAQNALLKMLEEPAADTVFLLTAPSALSVLPTIYSRTQHIELKSPAIKDMTAFLNTKGYSEDKISSALRYSGNRLGLASAVLAEDTTHPLLGAVSQAREALSSPLLSRLRLIDDWAGQKEELPDKLDALLRICQTGLNQAAARNETKLLKRWQRYYQAVYDTISSLPHSPNTKLLLTHLFLQLS